LITCSFTFNYATLISSYVLRASSDSLSANKTAYLRGMVKNHIHPETQVRLIALLLQIQTCIIVTNPNNT